MKVSGLISLSLAAIVSVQAAGDLERRFTKEVHPFVENYCLSCHDADTKKAELDLSPFKSVDAVAKDHGHWELVLERLRNGDMPPKKSKTQPSATERRQVIAWIESLRRQEAQRTAGDPGPVLPRRLSNAEYNYTIHDLTGVDMRPARTFPVDPANQAGFDNSGESLAMSPALVTKYLEAAREVSEHVALQPDGFTFAPHPVVADTDRDKWAVFRIVNFYRQQPTDYADYFSAAWRYRNRASKKISMEQVARESKVSARYLALISTTLMDKKETVGPIARLQAMFQEIPAKATSEEVREACEEMRDYVVRIREGIVPEVKNLKVEYMNDGAQPLVMWKNRQMAANRRKFNPDALKPLGSMTNESLVLAKATNAMNTKTNAQQRRVGRNGHKQAETPEFVKKGGHSLAPAFVTKESSATAHMAAARKRAIHPDLIVPDEPAERARYEAAFARFADIFPDAFYITERARVFLDAEKEQENAGRLLSAGFHSMTGYFRDDQPLYDLILDEAGKHELDRLWDEFNMISLVPQRMHTSCVWFDRTDSAFMRSEEFDPYRPEDKSIHSQEKIRGLAKLYLAKALRNGASPLAQQAIEEHFASVEKNILRVEQIRRAAEPTHLRALANFAERAYRRPLTQTERTDLEAFYKMSRSENGVEHEEAVRDCILRVLVSPKFLFRTDLTETTAEKGKSNKAQPLSDYALASRLSHFLWASMPDAELLARASANELHRPAVLRAQVQRMLKDARVRNFATEFAGNWLDFRRFEELNSVDRERFPMFNNELRTAMFEEPLRFFLDVAQRDRSVLDFIYARDTFVNAPLAKHYGITPAPESTNTWVHIENARTVGRGGVLPMAAFLTANSPGLRTSPVKRGNWVVKRILGERIPPPPAQVPELPKDEQAMGELTLRQALEKHRTREGCMECHARFDSMGLIFESFGPVGERRTLDLGGRPVDTRAEFPGGSQGDGLDGLVQYIREHRENDFIDNLCRKLLAYGLGRTLILGDEPLVREMKAKLAARDYRFSVLVESIVTSPQFLNARPQPNLVKN